MDASVLRLLDANANRAREALRVLEDYARFVLDDARMTDALKHLRHELLTATGDILPEAIVHRDTANDVGTTIKTEREMARSSIEEVVTAAGKRLGEALRSIEEHIKIVRPAMAGSVEQLRYRFYTIEKHLTLTLRPKLFTHVRLYVLITVSACKHNWLVTAKAAIAGGADALQLREKEMEGGELLRRATALAPLCRKAKVLLIINDRPDIAILSGADGVHVGQGDLPAVEARKIVGGKRIVGVSAHNIAQARQAVLDSADYIGVGPIFRSSTKPRDWQELPGLDFARQAVAEIKRPCVGIAGITAENVDQVRAAGITAIAVTAAITGADDVEQATRALKAKLTDN
jgi:thiamine-phosphate pyrophosphorylase